MKWICEVCGYEMEGDQPLDVCPVCGVGKENFVQVEEKKDNTNDIKTSIRPSLLTSPRATPPPL